LNECGHVPAELDWLPGEFFDDSKLYLICSIHGALYAPDTGRCLGGRCQGRGLKPLAMHEIDGQIFLNKTRIMDNPQSPNNDTAWERKVLEKLAFAALDEQRARRRWGIFSRPSDSYICWSCWSPS
jgi:hypothetical protein